MVHGSADLEGKGYKRITQVLSSCLRQLCSQICEIRDTHRAGNQWRNSQELVVSSWCNDWFGVLQAVKDQIGPSYLLVRPDINHVGGRVVLDVRRKVHKCRDLSGGCASRVHHDATPKRGEWECLQFVLGNNAKVVSASLQHKE